MKPDPAPHKIASRFRKVENGRRLPGWSGQLGWDHRLAVISLTASRRDSSAMIKTIGIALGAGVASGLLFLTSIKGTLFAVTLTYLAPLPIMIATLGWGQLPGF